MDKKLIERAYEEADRITARASAKTSAEIRACKSGLLRKRNNPLNKAVKNLSKRKGEIDATNHAVLEAYVAISGDNKILD